MKHLKIILILLIVFFSFSNLTPTYAALQPLKQDNFNYMISTQANWGAMIHTGLCTIVEVSIYNDCLVYTQGKATKVGEIPHSVAMVTDKPISGGAMGFTSNSIAYLLDNPPTSSTYYMANLGESIGLGAKPAYAQVAGSGNNILVPVFNLWQVSRNVSYLIFILIFMIVGIMIMMRHRLNPQTVVTAQQALPGLVIGLVFITFSYFVAALIVDLSFLATQLIGSIFIAAGDNFFSDIRGLANNSSLIQLFGTTVFQPGWMNQIGTISGAVHDQLFASVGGVGARIITSIIGFFVGAAAGGGLGAVIGTAAGAAGPEVTLPALILLLLVGAMFIQLVRLFFGLITSYIEILVFTILGPIIILYGSVPGNDGAIGFWWKRILGNSMVFPAVFGAFLFAGVILGAPVISANVQLPMFGNSSSDFIRFLLAYGIILGTPGIPRMVRDAFGIKPFSEMTRQATGSIRNAGEIGLLAAPGGARAAGAAPAGFRGARAFMRRFF